MVPQLSMMGDQPLHVNCIDRWVANPLRKNHIESTCAHMWPTCVHMWPTCVVPISYVYPHVRKIFHMWDTCEVMQTSTCGYRVSHMWLTWAHMWPTCGSCELSLNITLTCEMNMWNWNNTKNLHVDFMWFFCKGWLLLLREGMVRLPKASSVTC